MNPIAEGLAAGAIGAGTVAVLDGVLSRTDLGRGSRSVLRLGIATGLAYGADSLGAPSYVPTGIVSGAVLMTILDLGVALIGQQRRPSLPPAGAGAAALGAPWAPRPGWAL